MSTSTTKEREKIKRDAYERTPCPFCMGTGSISVRGKAVEDAREKCGMSRQALADALGMSHVTIRNIERGITKPQKTTLKYLIEEFRSRGVELDLKYSFGNERHIDRK